VRSRFGVQLVLCSWVLGCEALPSSGLGPPPPPPLRVLVLVDNSSSNAQRDPPRPELTRRGQALLALAEARPRATLGVITFDSRAHDLLSGLVPLDPPTTDARVRAAALALTAGDRYTDYSAALSAAATLLEDGPPEAHDELILIANGLPYAEPVVHRDVLRAQVRAMVDHAPPRRLHTVFLATGIPEQFQLEPATLLRELAAEGGGRMQHITGDEPLALESLVADAP
jgi:hypothetical protein